MAPAEAPSTAVTPEKTSESSQHVQTVTANETHKVENTTEPISTVEEKVNVATNADKVSDKKVTDTRISNETNKKIESEVREDKENEKVTVTEKISDPKVPEIKTDNKPTTPSTGYSRLFSVGNIRRPMSRSTVIGDNYPWPNAAVPYVEVDPWGLYKRECVSFVAYRLSTVNGFTIPYAYGNANQWGYRAQNEGYRVDMNPAAGSVAWFTGNKGFHVAWVVGVNGENVEIEEYNYGYTGRYNSRWISKNSVDGYIHFKDISSSPEKQAINKYITITKDGQDFFENIECTTKKAKTVRGRIYYVKIAYKLSNGQLLYSVYEDEKGTAWIGYLRQGSSEFTQLETFNRKKVSLTNNATTLWKDLNYQGKLGMSVAGNAYTVNRVFYNSTNNASYHELYQGNTFCGYVNSGAVKDIVSESKFKENPDMNQTDVLKTQDSMDEFIDFDNDGKENKESLKEDITEKNLSSKEESNKEQTEISY